MDSNSIRIFKHWFFFTTSFRSDFNMRLHIIMSNVINWSFRPREAAPIIMYIYFIVKNSLNTYSRCFVYLPLRETVRMPSAFCLPSALYRALGKHNICRVYTPRHSAYYYTRHIYYLPSVNTRPLGDTRQ